MPQTPETEIQTVELVTLLIRNGVSVETSPRGARVRRLEINHRHVYSVVSSDFKSGKQPGVIARTFVQWVGVWPAARAAIKAYEDNMLALTRPTVSQSDYNRLLKLYSTLSPFGHCEAQP